jgi:hypothetical protein
MMGCLRTVGCLTLLAAGAVGAWVTKDRWLPALTGEPRAVDVAYDPVTPARGERARTALRAMEQRTGPVFANLTAAEALALLLAERQARLPALEGAVEAAVVGDRLLMRAVVDPSALRGIAALGPLASMLESRARVTLAGTLDVHEPGTGLFVVREVRLNDLPVPGPALASLVRQLDRRPAPVGAPARAIAFPLPRSVGDVRVGKGRVTLYKRVP